MKIKLLTLALLCIQFCFSQGTTYFVDPAGDDSNTGTSQTSPWKSINKVNTTSFLPGDSVLFVKGGVWTDANLVVSSSGTDEAKITYGAYIPISSPSIGDKPIISSVSKIADDSNYNWIHVGGGIWKTTAEVANPGRLFTGYDPQDPSASTELLRAYDFNNLGEDTKSAVDGATLPKDIFFWSNDTTLTTTTTPQFSVLYVYTGNSTQSPEQEDLIYKSTNSNSSFFHVFMGNKMHVIMDGIELHGGANNIGLSGTTSSVSSRYIEIKNCLIGRFSYTAFAIINTDFCEIHDNLFDSAYTTKTGLTADDYDSTSTIPGSDLRGNGDAIRIINDGSDNNIYNNTFLNWGHAALELNGVDSGTGANQGITNNKFYNNYISAPQISYSRGFSTSGPVDTCTENEIFNNLLEHMTIQNQIGGKKNKIHHNIFRDFSQSDLRPKGYANGIEVINNQPGYESTLNKIDHNLFIDLDDAGLTVNFWGSTGPDDPEWNKVEQNFFRNNILYNCGRQENYHAIVIANNNRGQAPRLGGNTFKNNLVYSFDATGTQIDETINYYGIAPILAASTTYTYPTLISGEYTVSEFNSYSLNSGDVANGNIDLDPDFLDLTSGFHLAETSPCLDGGNSGTTTLYTNDYYNESFILGVKPDIGHQEIYNRTTQLTVEYCDEDLLIEDLGIIACDPIENTSLYRFKFTDPLGVVQYVDSDDVFVDLFDAWWAQAKTTYSVTVRKVPDSPADDYAFPHGTICTITTPHLTRLTDPYCDEDLPGSSGIIEAYPVLNATEYTFRFRDGAGNYTYYTTTNPIMNLYERSWVQTKHTYKVQVKAVSPTSSSSGFSYGPTCGVTTPNIIPTAPTAEAHKTLHTSLDYSANIVLYPNPAQDYVTVDFNANSELNILCLFDATGKTFLVNRDQNNQIWLGDMASGVYYLKIATEAGTYFKRIVKQ